eukprot:SAG11_NODE_1888_length_4115_cov_2.442480_4_plen_94_part_00
MSDKDRDALVLKKSLELDSCTTNGLDGDGLPIQGKGGRLFTFEVAYTTKGVTSTFRFQALSREDIQRWKIAITGDPSQLAPEGYSAEEPSPEQ